jgi:2-polyprenyl-3-methyl-5-hydroxy-6-metoxy-1,4-benzoquinol methylase
MSMPEWDDSSTRSWDSVADDWIRHADANDYRNELLLPLTLDLLGDVRGLEILDLGCGEGGYSRELAARGANVVGVDGSARLISAARGRAAQAGLEVEYLCANANALHPIGTASRDVVVAAMVLMDVEDYAGTIGEIWRVLRSGGRLLMSILHPCFSAPGAEWVKSEAGDLLFFKVDRYLQAAEWEDFITARFRQPVIRRHQPLEAFLRPLLGRGFVLRDLREPGAPATPSSSPRLERLNRIPYFLFLSWQKP